jgi:hypothetical protein
MRDLRILIIGKVLFFIDRRADIFKSAASSAQSRSESINRIAYFANLIIANSIESRFAIPREQVSR